MIDSDSLIWIYICLHDNLTKCNVVAVSGHQFYVNHEPWTMKNYPLGHKNRDFLGTLDWVAHL